MKIKMNLVVSVCMLAALFSRAAEIPVTVRQNWPWDQRVIIDLTMPSGTNDVELTASYRSDSGYHEVGLAVGNGLSRSTFCMTGGVYRFVWDPVKAGITGKMKELDISAVTYTATERAWLVVDVVTGESEYVALGDEPLDENGKPWQDNIYKKSKMVFRRIPAGTFIRGYTEAEKAYIRSLEENSIGRMLTAAETTLTSDYYITIYQVTRAQISRVKDAASTENNVNPDSGANFAAGHVCFQRGSNNVEGVNWPLTKFAVTTNSVVGLFRERCKNRFMIDLPTCAQWQRAARPDSKWLWYDTSSYPGGMTGGTVNDSFSTLTNIVAHISQAHKRKYVDKSGLYNPPSVPGTYLPNSFGMYDLIGSRIELLLDLWNVASEDAPDSAGIDPVGMVLESYNGRMVCNSYNNVGTLSHWALAFATTLQSDFPRNPSVEACYRYVIHLNPPQSFGGKWMND